MVAIRNNQTAPITIAYVKNGAEVGKLTLAPGVNLAVDDIEWEAASSHPMVKIYLAKDILEPLIKVAKPLEMKVTDDETGYEASHQVVDDKKTGQPMPVLGTIDPKKRTKKSEPVTDGESITS